MIIPSVMFIEMALDSLKARDPKLLEMEAKEFAALGPQRQQDAQQSLDPMVAGYLIGLETARVLLASNIKAVQAKVEL